MIPKLILPALFLVSTLGVAAPPGPVAVRLISPLSDRPVFGKTTIEIEVASPEGVTALKVEIHVDGRLHTTLFDPPFRVEWDASDGAEPHHIRAKVFTSDGSVTSAEVRTIPRLGIEKARVLLVEVYAVVKDEESRFVTDLSAGDFSILDSGVPQKISLFTSERKPVQIVLLVDVSASMRREDRLAKAIEAARLFIESLEPGDRVAVCAFSDAVKVIEPFTTDRSRSLGAISALAAERGTALYDAVHAAAGLLGREEGRRALVLLSDGQDLAFDGLAAGSARSFEEAVSEVLRQQVTAYTIGLGEQLGTDWDFNRSHTAEQVLDRLALETGGRFLEVRRPGKLKNAFERILEELRFQYTLGYNPSRDKRDGAWRPIEVKVLRPRLTVRARKGYFAPTD